MTKSKLLIYYRTRAEKYDKLLAGDKRVISWLSLLRFLVFVGGITLATIQFNKSNAAGFITLLMSMIIFGILLKIYSLRAWMRDYHTNMLAVNLGEEKTVSEDYSQFKDGSRFADPSHSFSHDIDLFGKGSVFQSINRTCTERGEAMLASWILNPFKLSEKFLERRDSIRELADMIEWRQKFASLGMMNKTSEKETLKFFEWMNEDSQFSDNRLLGIILYVFPLASIILFVLVIGKFIGLSWFVLMVLINLFLVAVNLGRLNRLHVKVSNKSNYLSTVGSLIEHIENENFESHFLQGQKTGLRIGNVPAMAKIRRLARILQSFDSRLNMIMGAVLNGLLLWDYQCVIRIERWKKELAHLVPVWFDSIARMDAIISLAAYAKNNPEFAYPELSDGGTFLLAESLGHHLIPSDKRVTNNYSINSIGAINIVTGANMAGKSTFLRTVAVNLVLGMCGAPVCAKKFIFSPIDIFTSMRTTDSLTEEESYFFAELKRLRRLIERIQKGDKLFFILDEILKGTNSKDKSEGSKAFIEKVIQLGGTGLIATHDISLGQLEIDHPVKVSNNCFEIEIADGDVKFDFILRKGITSKMNAALLMKQQGII